MPSITLIGQDIGNPARPGSTLPHDTGYDLVGSGADIWMQSDQFHFAWTKRTGDFVFVARVASLEPTHQYAKAGLMARDTLAPDSPHVFVLAFPDNQPRNKNNGGIEGHVRPSAADKTTAIYPPAPLPQVPDFPVEFPSVWLRLQRKGDDFTSGHSRDGRTWKQFFATTLALRRELYLGLAVTSHDATKSAQAGFRDLSLA